ncbi:hypothetical protein ACT8ZR_24750 [Neobacillus sp. M.A.Huq-85]
MNEQLTENELFHSQWLIINYLYNIESATLVEIANFLHERVLYFKIRLLRQPFSYCANGAG